MSGILGSLLKLSMDLVASASTYPCSEHVTVLQHTLCSGEQLIWSCTGWIFASPSYNHLDSLARPQKRCFIPNWCLCFSESQMQCLYLHKASSASKPGGMWQLVKDRFGCLTCLERKLQLVLAPWNRSGTSAKLASRNEVVVGPCWCEELLSYKDAEQLRTLPLNDSAFPPGPVLLLNNIASSSGCITAWACRWPCSWCPLILSQC